MSWLSIGYLVILVIALGVLLWVRHQIIFPARTKWGWRIFYFTAALLAALMTWLTSTTVDGLVSGGFITVMFAIFGFWRRGLSDSALINGLGSLRAYSVLTAIRLEATDQGTSLSAMVGSVTVIRMQLLAEVQPVAQFLKQRMPPERVIIVQ